MSADNPLDQRLVTALEQIAQDLQHLATTTARIANVVAPQPANIVGTKYVAERLGCTTTWVSDMIRQGQVPDDCIVKGTGTGKLWKLHRAAADRWIESRSVLPTEAPASRKS
jgi:hypothetical protein